MGRLKESKAPHRFKIHERNQHGSGIWKRMMSFWGFLTTTTGATDNAGCTRVHCWFCLAG